MLLKEYRICMPLSVEEYRIGQLYMIAKHSHEQSSQGEGVEVIANEPWEDPKHGKGQFTEKRIYLSSKLPTWVASWVPNIFYITEKAWNYYPYTITVIFTMSVFLCDNLYLPGTFPLCAEYTCSFIPRFSIHIETTYENNTGTSDNCLGLEGEELSTREVDFVDIVNDEYPAHHYKEEEDLAKFKSTKTNRGPLSGENWKDEVSPVMCSYKVARVKFEMWGLQGRVESFTQNAVRDILLVGHRQAVAWIDEWIGMTMDDIRDYEKNMHEETNKKVGAGDPPSSTDSAPNTPNNTPTESDSLEKRLAEANLGGDSETS